MASFQLFKFVTGKHRSADLAARHFSQLQRQFKKPRYKVSFVDRQRGDGTSSPRGHFFVFKIEKREPRNREYIVHIKYKPPRKKFQGKKPFEADLYFISKDTDPIDVAMLEQQAKDAAPLEFEDEDVTFLSDWIASGYAKITKGKTTDRAQTVKVRSFKRL